jgi:hypothetical protein
MPTPAGSSTGASARTQNTQGRDEETVSAFLAFPLLQDPAQRKSARSFAWAGVRARGLGWGAVKTRQVLTTAGAR